MYKRITSIVFGIFPLLSVYSFPNSSIDFGTLTIFILFLSGLNIKGIIDTKIRNWMICIILFSIGMIFNILYRDYSGIDVYLRALNLMVVPLMIFYLIVNRRIDFNVSIKSMKYLIQINTIIILIQIFLSKIGIYFQNGFVFLSKSSDYKDRIVTGPLRPSGIFLEPAHFIQYASILLIFTLFIRSKNSKIHFFIVMLGMFLTTSAQGYLNITLVVVVYFLKKIIENNFSLKNILVVFSFCFIGLLFIFNLSMQGYFDFIVDRLFTDNASLGGNAIHARTSGYSILSNLKGYKFVFGNGLGNTINGIYSSGYVVLTWTTGIIGLITTILISLINVNKNIFSVLVLIIFLFMMFFSQMFTASSLAFYFGFAWWGTLNMDNKENINDWHNHNKLQYME